MVFQILSHKSFYDYQFLNFRIALHFEIVLYFIFLWKDQGEISVLLVPRTKKSNCKTLSWLIDVSFIEEIPLCNQERAEICLVDYFERPFVLSGTPESQKSWWGQVCYVVGPLITIESKYLTKNVGDQSPRPHTFRQHCAKGKEISEEFSLASIPTKKQRNIFLNFCPSL